MPRATPSPRRRGRRPEPGGEPPPERLSPTGTPAQGRELRARGQRTMRRLLEAGMEVFATRGYHAARVDDIVKLAKTSHGTFYLYFSNKEDLFRALAGEVAREMEELAASLGDLGPGPEGERALHDWITRFADLYEHYGPVIRAWTEAEIGNSEFGRLGTELLTGFTVALADRIRAAKPPGIDPPIASIALVAMLERLNYFVLARQVDMTRAQMIDTLASVTHAALFGGHPRTTR